MHYGRFLLVVYLAVSSTLALATESQDNYDSWVSLVGTEELKSYVAVQKYVGIPVESESQYVKQIIRINLDIVTPLTNRSSQTIFVNDTEIRTEVNGKQCIFNSLTNLDAWSQLTIGSGYFDFSVSYDYISYELTFHRLNSSEATGFKVTCNTKDGGSYGDWTLSDLIDLLNSIKTSDSPKVNIQLLREPFTLLETPQIKLQKINFENLAPQFNKTTEI